MIRVLEVRVLELHTLWHELIFVLRLLEVLVDIHLLALLKLFFLNNPTITLQLLIPLLPILTYLYLIRTILTLTFRVALLS